jgi:hypothetical protein
MKYLMRAAQRLSNAGPLRTRPAIPSRSPLAEADQRLNIDSFAEKFEAPLHPPAIALPEDEAPASLTSPALTGSAPGIRSDPAGEGAPPSTSEGQSESVERLVPASRTAPRRETGQTLPTGDSPAGEASERGTPASINRTTRQNQPVRDEPVTAPPREETAATADQVKTARPARRVNPLPDPLGADEMSRVSDRSRAESLGSMRDIEAQDGSAERVFEALNRAMSWVAGSGSAGAAEKKATPAPSSQSRFPSTVQSVQPARAASGDTRPITHLEIGKIEVEVVSPVKPARAAAPPRTGSQATGHGSSWRSTRQTFGWRQR